MAKKVMKKGGLKATKSTAIRWNGNVEEKEIQRVAQLIKENNIEIVDLKFNDLPGLWQHFSIPATEL